MNADPAAKILKTVGMRLREMDLEDVTPDKFNEDGMSVIVEAQEDYTDVVVIALETKIKGIALEFFQRGREYQQHQPSTHETTT